MGKMIKITRRGEVGILDYPEGKGTKPLCRELGCDLVERVRPKRLYSCLRVSNKLDPSKPGEVVCMLVDEEGRLKPNTPNLIASWMYETDLHRQPIVGDVLLVGEKVDEEGNLTFCGIEDVTGLALFVKLNKVVEAFKEVDLEGEFIG